MQSRNRSRTTLSECCSKSLLECSKTQLQSTDPASVFCSIQKMLCVSDSDRNQCPCWQFIHYEIDIGLGCYTKNCFKRDVQLRILNVVSERRICKKVLNVVDGAVRSKNFGCSGSLIRVGARPTLDLGGVYDILKFLSKQIKYVHFAEETGKISVLAIGPFIRPRGLHLLITNLFRLVPFLSANDVTTNNNACFMAWSKSDVRIVSSSELIALMFRHV